MGDHILLAIYFERSEVREAEQEGKRWRENREEGGMKRRWSAHCNGAVGRAPGCSWVFM